MVDLSTEAPVQIPFVDMIVVVAGMFLILAAIVGVTYWAIRLGEYVRTKKGRIGFAWFLVITTVALVFFCSVMAWVIYTAGFVPN